MSKKTCGRFRCRASRSRPSSRTASNTPCRRAATGRVEIVGSTSGAEAALKFLAAHVVDVLFLDIQMPVLNGFELLEQLHQQPLVIFTTAFDRYALNAFEVNSIDYLLKPIEP